METFTIEPLAQKLIQSCGREEVFDKLFPPAPVEEAETNGNGDVDEDFVEPATETNEPEEQAAQLQAE